MIQYPDDLCASATEDHGRGWGVIAQLSELTGRDRDALAEEFDELIGDAWRGHGLSSRSIMAWCHKEGRGACCYHGSKQIEVHPGPRSLVWTVWGDRCYFYQSAHIKRRLMNQLDLAPKAKRLREHGPSSTPVFSEWLPWTTLAPGHCH